MIHPPAPRRLHPQRKTLMSWLTNLLSKIPPSIEKPLWALIVAGLTFLAAKYGILVPAPVNNNTVVVSPSDADPSFLATAPKAGGFHPMVHPLIRAHLALAVEQRDGISFAEAWGKVRKVSRADLEDGITAASTKLGVFGQLGDGTLIQKIIDFLNSPQGQALIALLLKLLPLLLADGHDAVAWPAFDDCHTVRGPPYPLEWAGRG